MRSFETWVNVAMNVESVVGGGLGGASRHTWLGRNGIGMVWVIHDDEICARQTYAR